jgi:hypothetical protein
MPRTARALRRFRAEGEKAMVSWELLLIALVLGAVFVLLWRRGLG